jgi:hypothetical protein
VRRLRPVTKIAVAAGRLLGAVAPLTVAACAGAMVAPASTPLEQAARNYPPLIMGANIRPTDGTGPYARSCPTAGSRVEQKGGPALEFLGADPANQDLCRMRIAGQTMTAWYGIWATDWPGAAEAYPAMQRVIRGRTGEVAAFDTRAAPGLQWHDLVRNEGIEDIKLLGTIYHAVKLSHYREGYDGNSYRSVSTVWKDIPTGLLLYGTYQHISGRPELDDPLIPTAIVPAATPPESRPRPAGRGQP